MLMRTIPGGPADKAGIKFSINPDTIADDKEEDFDRIINHPEITRVSGSSGWKNKKETKRSKS